MKLTWYGHSCFALTYADGTAIVIDPFDDSVGYPLCDARADAVGFYQKLGFHKTGEQKIIFRLPHYRMELNLNE